MIECRGVRFAYARGPVLQGVDLRAERGQVTVLLGPNGCGKSTLLGVLAGQLRPAGGEVLLNGQNLRALPRRARARGIALLRQDDPASALPAGEVVLAGRYPHRRARLGWSAEDRAVAARAMARTGCQNLAGRPERGLSGGERQRVRLAAALAQEADALLLDEPTTFLDVGVSLAVLRLARELAAEGRAVVAVLHDLPLAMRFAHRVVLMRAGRVEAAGSPGELLDTGAVEAVFGVAVHRLHREGLDYFAVE